MSYGNVDYKFALGEVGKGIWISLFDLVPECSPEDLTGYSANMRIRLPDGCLYSPTGAIISASSGEIFFEIDPAQLGVGLNLGQINITDDEGNTFSYFCSEETALRILLSEGV